MSVSHTWNFRDFFSISSLCSKILQTLKGFSLKGAISRSTWNWNKKRGQHFLNLRDGWECCRPTVRSDPFLSTHIFTLSVQYWRVLLPHFISSHLSIHGRSLLETTQGKNECGNLFCSRWLKLLRGKGEKKLPWTIHIVSLASVREMRVVERVLRDNSYFREQI
jgi:hypothetical protein